MADIVKAVVKNHIDTAANLASDNITPLDGEITFESDTRFFKVGDGVTAYNSLTFLTSEKITGSTDQIAKAWVNFNGTGTVAIRDSFNVSSITDNGTGDYTINFSSAFSDINYNISKNVSLAINAVSFSACPYVDVPTTTTLRVNTWNTAITLVDAEFVDILIFTS